MPKLQVKSSRDLTSRIITRLNKAVPETDVNGTLTVRRSSDVSEAPIRYVVKTGIRAFDDRVGGILFGGTVEFFGPPFCGKSALAVRTANRAQQGFIYERIPGGTDGKEVSLVQLKPGTFNVTVLYYDNEITLTEPWMLVTDGHSLDCIIEQCDTVDLLWKTMESVMDAVSEEEAKTGIRQFLIVVLDTVASVSSTEQLKLEWNERDFPRAPKQIRNGFQVLLRRLGRENVLLMGLNHVSKRMNTRGRTPAYRAWDTASPGGQAFKYYSRQRVYFEMVESKYRMSKQGGAEGMLVYFFTEKNRLRLPFREGRLALLFGNRDLDTGQIITEGGFSDSYSVLESLVYGKAANVSKQTGAITFDFHKFGVPAPSFGSSTLEDQADEDAARRKSPRMSSRAEWPVFYAAHAADFDALYAAVTAAVFNKPMSLEDVQGPGEETDENESDE